MKKSLFIILLLLPACLSAQLNEKYPYLLTSAEVLKLMEESPISYEVSFNKSLNDKKEPEYRKVSNELYLVSSDTGSVLFEYHLSPEGQKTLDQARIHYMDQEYDSAIVHYRQILKSDPSYMLANTWIGDMYYMKQNYDSAKYYFNLAIQKNFIDYTAHWFLADTYNKLDEHDKALEQITTAHLLNRNHPEILAIMKQYRKLAGKEWKDWNIAPKCSVYKKDNKICVEMTEDWVGYACAEALWKFEPGFAERISGSQYQDDKANFQKDAGCIVTNLAQKSMKDIAGIIEDGYFHEMVWYEMTGRKAPEALLLFPDEFLSRLTEYVNKYH